MASYNGSFKNKYGRQTIYINRTEEELLKQNIWQLRKTLSDYIPAIVDLPSYFLNFDI